MKYAALLIPLLFLSLFIYAIIKKIKLYDCFTEGIQKAIPLVVSLFPYLAAIFMLSELFEQSGISAYATKAVSPLLQVLGVPPELSKLVLMKPFSGSGSTALLSEILATYGADSYLSRCACVCYGSSETVFYISAVYFAGIKQKKLFLPVVIVIVSNFIALVFGCFLCKIV